MNNKLWVLTNIYVCTRYFIGFTFLKNVVLLAKTTSLSSSYEFISQHNMHLLVFVRKLIFLKYSCQKTLKKKLCKTSIFRRVAGCKTFFKGFPALYQYS